MSILEIIDNAGSTNSALSAKAAALPHGYALMARCQSAGRGQRGNSWESEPGHNVTLSILLRPVALEAANQFSLSEAVALGVVDTLAAYGIDATVKWPNDIYVDNLKICGILIENSLAGRIIDRSIAGIGLNVNQMQFTSPAPNPVSMRQLLAQEFPVDQVARIMIDKILALTDSSLSNPDSRAALHLRYLSHMWRNDGTPYPYLDAATRQRVLATIIDVAPTGHITLRHKTDGSTHTYAFKEIHALLD